MPHRLRLALSVLLITLSASEAASAQDTSFDGNWLVILACTGAQDGAAGYTLRFLARVQRGTLHGETGVRGQAGSLSLDGPIQPDGTALLQAEGRTGRPENTVGRVASGTPYRYTMQARFAGNRGTGSRIELRPCDAVFTRQ